MKTDLTTTGYSQAKPKTLPLPKDAAAVKPGAKSLDNKLATAAGSGPDYKLDLASKASPGSPSGLSSPPLPGAPATPSFTPSSTPSTPDLPSFKSRPVEPLKDELDEAAKESLKTEAPKKIEVKDGSVRKPAIIFIKGLDLFSSPSKSEGGYAGVGRIADSIKGSQVFSWGDKDAILKEIKTIHKDQPIVLVGHSLGGDTALEVANELDSLDHQFRPVDLLVTMDAVGFDHDIIPQNVRKHLNVFGERDFFLNDGPHVARRHETTDVKNILSPLNHTELDDDKEVQFEVVNMIQKAIIGS